jgi:hypothetical protein
MDLQEVDALLRVEMPTGRSNVVELSARCSKTQGQLPGAYTNSQSRPDADRRECPVLGVPAL